MNKLKKPLLNTSNILFVIFLVLLIIPQTRIPIQVAVNKIKVLVWSPSAIDEIDQNQLQPFTYKLASLENVDSTIEIGKGNVSFISYWATWCPPCVAELPSIQKLYADYGDRVNFILITNEKQETVREFLTQKSYDLPVYFPQMKAPKELNSISIPTNYVIDKSGQIIIKETGAADWNSKKVRTILDELGR